jgi:hypothetical protein
MLAKWRGEDSRVTDDDHCVISLFAEFDGVLSGGRLRPCDDFVENWTHHRHTVANHLFYFLENVSLEPRELSIMTVTCPLYVKPQAYLM